MPTNLTRLPPARRSARSLEDWADRLVQYLASQSDIKQPSDPRVVQLAHQIADADGNTGIEKAFTSGLLMFDPALDRVVYSSEDQSWEPLAAASSSQAGTATVGVGTNTITFPIAYAAAPAVVATATGIPTGANTVVTAMVGNVTATSFDVRLTEIDTAFSQYVRDTGGTLNWIAIGA